ncbi:MAG: hypothetical protein ABI435_01760 [Pseudolysinimonas sp.]
MTITSIPLGAEAIRAREAKLAERDRETVTERTREIRERRFEEQARSLGAILTHRDFD